ncbi:hypothetical protein GGX14DRAFT_411724 [Mycena pura]|uniref:N-acetyltransferase domain-containing protein n=1 Tax=Mycena pura TaxID=153505 RepID=A0AAD7E701_9AGAR|nr:hypothetical protein GGX14DRAFT_411724 [Mycena pura]
MAAKQPVFVRRLVDPTEDEIEECTALLVAAFQAVTDDNFGHSLIGGDKELDILLLRAGVRAGIVGGEVWVAGLTEEVTVICAVAIWFGPGTDYLATEEQRAAGYNDARSKFSPELKQWYSGYFVPRLDDWQEDCLGKNTTANSWHLQFLATSPDHQHKGFASALIQAVEPKAHAAGVLMCLETTNDQNVAFYKKRGFAVRGTISFVGSGGETIMTCLSK